MNQNIYQLSRIVMTARRAIVDNKDYEFRLEKYERQISYVLHGEEKDIYAQNTEEWFRVLRNMRVSSIYLLMNSQKEFIEYAGSSNADACIVTISAKEVITWCPAWEYDFEKGLFTTEFEAHNCLTTSTGIFLPRDTRKDFKDILQKIMMFSKNIRYEKFASIFHEAYGLLSNQGKLQVPKNLRETIPDMTEDQLRVFLAAYVTDVFGGMGSWNDGPACEAHVKGLQTEYQELSTELRKQIDNAILFVVNGGI